MNPFAQKFRLRSVLPVCLCVAFGNSAGLHAAQNPLAKQRLQQMQNAPLYFEANHGQAGDASQFIARGRDCNILLSPTNAEMVLAPSDHPQQSAAGRTVRLRFTGANAAAGMTGLEELSGRANYFLGNEPVAWHTGIPLFSKVAVDDLYPGVRLVYYCSRQQLEYDFQLQPGVDPGIIRFSVEGADAIRLDHNGNLVLQIGEAEIREHKPVVYQMINGVRQSIVGRYRMNGKDTVGFDIGDFDRSKPLVIDPILSFSTYFGGTKGDIAWDIALDGSGNVYVAGETFSDGLATPGAFQNAYAGKGHYDGDAFVAKFANGSSNLVYLTYLGGTKDDAALGIAVDSEGNAFVTGFTDSSDFPVANSAVQNQIAGHNNNASHIYPIDAFVAKIGPEGTNLLYSTFLGGESREAGNAIAVDSAGAAYVTGYTQSTNFAAMMQAPHHYRTNYAGGSQDAFVAKIESVSNLATLAYCTYLGGTNQDNGQGISVDAQGCAYVTGFTLSTNFPTVPLNNSWFNGQTNKNSGAYDAFFTKLSPSGDGLIYSTYLGGDNTDLGLRNAVDSARNLYVTGYTLSTNFPVFPADRAVAFHSWVGRTNGFCDVFLTRFSPVDGSEDALYVTNYSIKFGGKRADVGVDVAVDSAGNAYLTGYTSSTNFPVMGSLAGGLSATNSSQGRHGRTNDVFVSAINSDASAFLYSAYLGGRSDDAAYGIAVDPATGDAYIAGQTASTNFPTVNPYELHARIRANTNDAFVAKILMQPALTIQQTNGGTLVAWPGMGSEFMLESATNPVGDSWTQVGQPPATNGWHKVVLDKSNAAGFFRLQYRR